MKRTIYLNDEAEAVYKVTQLPANVTVITDIPEVAMRLHFIKDNHNIITTCDFKRMRSKRNVVHIISCENAARFKKAEIIVGKDVTHFESKIFWNMRDFVQFLKTLNPGVLLASRDIDILETIGSCRKDLRYTANLRDPFAFPVILGTETPSELKDGRTVFYIAQK